MGRLLLLRGILAAALLPLAGAAAAQGRPATPQMTCAETTALVARAGAIVLATGPFTYERIVRDGSFCALDQTTRADFERTRDVAQCFVGYRCVDRFSENTNTP